MRSLNYFDCVIALAAKGEQFGLMIIDQKEATGGELDQGQAEDLVRRLADLLFTTTKPAREQAKENKPCR